MAGKSITLFLKDGDSEGRWQAELSNWNGIAYKIPHTMLQDSGDLTLIHTPGVYFLFGKDDDADHPFIYVGEADDVFQRLGQQHTFEKNDESYWTEAIVFVTSSRTLDKGKIKYLENRFYHLAKEAKRYEIKNGNTPKKSPLSEQAEATMEEFMQNVRLIMPALGHRVFEPFTERKGKKNSLLYFSRNDGKGGYGIGQLTNDGFVVMKNSYIFPEMAEYLPAGIRKAREKYAKIIDKKNILQENVVFGSPSYAAMFVCGKSVNGLIEWKNHKGETLKFLSHKDSIPIQTGKANRILVGKGLKAFGNFDGKLITVLKGSEICETETASIPPGIHKRREKLLAEGKVKKGKLIEDVTFTSLSTAAGVILGRSANGRAEWSKL